MVMNDNWEKVTKVTIITGGCPGSCYGQSLGARRCLHKQKASHGDKQHRAI